MARLTLCISIFMITFGSFAAGWITAQGYLRDNAKVDEDAITIDVNLFSKLPIKYQGKLVPNIGGEPSNGR